MNFWQAMFHWPTGGIYSNLLASTIWVIPGFLWSRGHFKKIHRHNEYMKLRTEQLHKHLGIRK